MPRTKSEDSRPKDKLLDGGMIFNNNGGWDVVDNVEKGDIEVDSWCVVGIGGVTGSGV
jgi:hypothetical protein